MVANNNSSNSPADNDHVGHTITLNIHIPQSNLTQMMQFDLEMFVGDVCRAIHEHLSIPMDQDRKMNCNKNQIYIH